MSGSEGLLGKNPILLASEPAIYYIVSISRILLEWLPVTSKLCVLRILYTLKANKILPNA